MHSSTLQKLLTKNSCNYKKLKKIHVLNYISQQQSLSHVNKHSIEFYSLEPGLNYDAQTVLVVILTDVFSDKFTGWQIIPGLIVTDFVASFVL